MKTTIVYSDELRDYDFDQKERSEKVKESLRPYWKSRKH